MVKLSRTHIIFTEDDMGRKKLFATEDRGRRHRTVPCLLTYRIVNGELVNDGATYADDTLYYRYLNHP